MVQYLPQLNVFIASIGRTLVQGVRSELYAAVAYIIRELPVGQASEVLLIFTADMLSTIRGVANTISATKQELQGVSGTRLSLVVLFQLTSLQIPWKILR